MNDRSKIGRFNKVAENILNTKMKIATPSSTKKPLPSKSIQSNTNLSMNSFNFAKIEFLSLIMVQNIFKIWYISLKISINWV